MYVYYDPLRGHSPFYVGKATSLYVAYRHLNGKSHSQTVSGRISRIRKLGSEPGIGIYVCENDVDAIALEQTLIEELGRRVLNKGPLLNLTDGGDGACGRIVSQETSDKIAKALTGKSRGPHKLETIEKIKASHVGRTYHSASGETKAKMRQAHLGVEKPEFSKLMKGRPKSSQMRERLSAAKIGIPRPKLTCPHCGKQGGDGNMKRWHFDNCKHKSL